MRVLIIGGAGMLGHKLWQVCAPRLEAWVTVRQEADRYRGFGLFDPDRLLDRVDVCVIDEVVRALDHTRPAVVVNAAGIVKQHQAIADADRVLAVNAVFPHRLAALCRHRDIRLIHISTDCVFSGRGGTYTEDDVPDAEDLYGQSKLLGEMGGERVLILRTSMIGRELFTARGLVEWFLSQRSGRVRGYRQAIFSGLPTRALAQIIVEVIQHHRALAGLFHVAAEPISKYDLLCLLRAAYHADVEIEPDDEVGMDRSLDATRFLAATGWRPAPWPDLIKILAEDPTPYEEWRRTYAS